MENLRKETFLKQEFILNMKDFKHRVFQKSIWSIYSNYTFSQIIDIIFVSSASSINPDGWLILRSQELGLKRQRVLVSTVMTRKLGEVIILLETAMFQFLGEGQPRSSKLRTLNPNLSNNFFASSPLT